MPDNAIVITFPSPHIAVAIALLVVALVLLVLVWLLDLAERRIR